ncbi:uncharacterized protein UTRI_10004 [Ustilago trichophora]|uniref:Paired domain-containing protein n=1 Tax=Ustilago trichophora TaxID=86804 RepID=A0A5C3DQ90_9BASI|nr:uncharacterized protein UTRI_10004 [Ustilago trichophora]
MPRHRTITLEFRQKIVDAVLRGESLSGIAKRYEFPYSSVYGVWKRYEEVGTIEAGQRGGQIRKSRLQDEHVEFLIGVLEERPGATLNELRDELNEHCEGATDVPLQTISRALEDRARMTLKRLHVEHDRHNSDATRAARQEYARRFHLDGKSYSDAVFFDEAGFNLQMTRTQGRAPTGERALVQDRPANRGRNISLLVAVDSTGIQAHRTIIGAWNASKLIEFFNKAVFPIFDGQQKTFVMDNARFHHNHGFLDLVRDHGHTVEFLPPYSPWLNIAKNVFSKIKPIVSRQQLTEHSGLVNLISNTLSTVTGDNCRGWIREATRWLVVAEAGHPLGHDHDAAAAIDRFGL